MRKIFHFLSIMIFLFLTVTFNLFADIRTENIELFLVIDKSKSMVEEISDVTDYINKTFVRNFLISGDRLVLIQFYGKADLIYDGIISNSNINGIMSDISDIPADGRFTDIGNALDRLERAVSSDNNDSKRKYLILLTDGRQEAPPDSKYYTPDGSFNHEFLKNTKIIQKAGWKVMILGIGTETAVDELAEELGTTSETLDFIDTIPAQKTASEIIGRILASDPVFNDGIFSLTLESEGYDNERTIIIEQITYQLKGGNYALLEAPETFKINPGSSLKVDFKISEKSLNALRGNTETGSIIFKFSGDTPFLPAVFESLAISPPLNDAGDKKVSEKSSDSENNEVNWLIIIIIIVAAAAVIAVFIIRNLIFHKDDDEGKIKKNDEISVDR